MKIWLKFNEGQGSQFETVLHSVSAVSAWTYLHKRFLFYLAFITNHNFTCGLFLKNEGTRGYSLGNMTYIWDVILADVLNVRDDLWLYKSKSELVPHAGLFTSSKQSKSQVSLFPMPAYTGLL